MDEGKGGGNAQNDQRYTKDELQGFINNPDDSYFKGGVYDLESMQGRALRDNGFIGDDGRVVDGAHSKTGRGSNDEHQESRR